MTKFDAQNEFSETKGIVRYAVVDQVLNLIRRTRSSRNNPVYITSLPGEFWQMERLIIAGLPKNCFVSFWCFEKELSKISRVKRNQPEDGNNYEISLNCDGDQRDYFYFYDEGALNINLGDFCGITTKALDDFVEAVNITDGETIYHGYNYINLYVNGRNGAREYLAKYKGETMEEKRDFIIDQIQKRITNPDVKLVCDILYKNNRSTFLSLAYETRSDRKFLKNERGVKEEMAKSAKMVAAGYKAAATRQANARRADYRIRGLKAAATRKANELATR